MEPWYCCEKAGVFQDNYINREISLCQCSYVKVSTKVLKKNEEKYLAVLGSVLKIPKKK